MLFGDKAFRLRRWELALLLAVWALLLTGLWLDREQNELSERVLRLHVLANSDASEDQALKLQVRDRILTEVEALLPPDADRTQAEAVLTENLERLAQAGAETVAQAGYDYAVTASLEDAWFPTKEYGSFALPAGEYRALRVMIGEGGGRNWWCVVFPPLCLSSVSETADLAQAGLTEQQTALITGESEGYVVKFKAIELWEQLQHWAGG